MRKTIQHTITGWSGRVIESKIIGKRTVKLKCGMKIIWYKIDDGRAADGWVSWPMRMHLDKESNWFRSAGGRSLADNMRCYKGYLAHPNRAQFTDITTEETELAAALMMAYEMGVE